MSEKVHAVVARSTFLSEECRKTDGSRTTFWRSDVEKVHAVVVRSTFCCGAGHFLMFRCRFAWQAQGIVDLVKSEQKREGFLAVSTTTTSTVHYTPLHYTPPHYTQLHYTTTTTTITETATRTSTTTTTTTPPTAAAAAITSNSNNSNNSNNNYTTLHNASS